MPEFNETLEVKVRNETFWFRVPGPLDMAKVGARAHEMRRKASPSTGGVDFGLDALSSDLFMGMAMLETLLVKADCKDNWPFSVGTDGKPTVNSEVFPPRSIRAVGEVPGAFYAAMNTFLDDGVGDGEPAGEEALDRQSDVPAVPVGTAAPVRP